LQNFILYSSESQSGIPFTLTLTVIDTNNCSAIINTAVDLWHCNSVGVYSHFETSTLSTTTYLRGIQLTDSNGQATFNTIYPGYYSGRATHVHVKVRFGGTETDSGSIYYWGGHTSHTGQIFFNDSYTTLVQAVTPYSSNTVSRTLNSVDRVYTQQDGVDSLVTLAYINEAQGINAGFIGTIILKVDSTVGVSNASSNSSSDSNTTTGITVSSDFCRKVPLFGLFSILFCFSTFFHAFQ
jgi:protocatechuate 3,4-dioxygenase beta subunit